MGYKMVRVWTPGLELLSGKQKLMLQKVAGVKGEAVHMSCGAPGH